MYRLLYSLMFVILILACKPEQKAKVYSQDISIEQAAKLNSEGYLYIDLRTKDEIQQEGKIDGSINIDFSSEDFEQKISLLPKSKKYIAYCAGGGRSARSMPIFEKHNIEAHNMIGGYGSWKNDSK